MKLKLLLFILLLPLSLHAANTNVFERVMINSTFQFKGGSPGLNKVLTSDAAGFYTPQSISALEATLITNATTTAPFLSIGGQGTHILTFAPVGTVITNNASPTFNVLTATTVTNTTLVVTGNAKVIGFSTLGGVYAFMATNQSLVVADNAQMGTSASGLFSVFNTAWSMPNGAMLNAGVMNIPADTTGTITNGAAGTVFAGNTTQIGTNAAHVLTLSGATLTAPNTLNINAGVLTLPTSTAGTTTNGVATTLFQGILQGATAGGITTYGCSTDTNIVFNGNNGAAFGFMKFRQTSTTNILGSIPVVNVWYTNPTQQKAAVSFGVVLPAGASTISQVGIFRAQSGFTNIWKMTSSAGLASESITNNSPTIILDPGAQIIVTNLNTTAGTPTLDPALSTTDYQ